MWAASGHWADRGVKVGQYVMGRIGDRGGYEPGNVEIVRVEDNNADRQYSRFNRPRKRSDFVKTARGGQFAPWGPGASTVDVEADIPIPE